MSLRLIVCLSVALGGAIASAPARSAIPAAERDALVALYNSTGGANWKTNTGWNGAPGTECGWFGVFCDDAQSTVVAIDLHDNGLTGTFVPLGAFTHLQGFVAYNNAVAGNLPALTSLTALVEFDVGGNQLTGPVPAFSGLPVLQHYGVSGNQLSGTLPAFANLPALQEVDFSYNQLSGQVPALDSLSALVSFNIAVNGFSGQIPPLAGLKNLQSFIAYGNSIGGTLPALPASIVTLSLSGNQLQGSLPATLSNLSALVSFDVGSNQLTGTLPTLTGLTKLQYFDCSSNQISGSIPSFSGLSALQDIELRFNKLQGPVPNLSGLTALQRVDFGDNQLSGQLPPMTNLPSLQGFSFELNQLSGPIPALDALTAVTYVNVQYNQLSGQIPPLSNLKALQDFSVAANNLSGPIPSLDGLTRLQTFKAPHNHLDHAIPTLAGLTSLQDFEVQDNALTGNLPALDGLANLQQLVIDDNQLDGPLPSFASTVNLQGFYAGYNRFTGPLPALRGLTQLQRFYVDSNQLDGAFPDLTGLTQLQYFSVANNHLSGNLPSFATLTSLIYFDASYNTLSGPIPALTGLSKLQTLYLGFNRLSGSTPDLAGLAALQTVVLDDNVLDGTLGSFAGASALTDFVASNNQLTGSIPALTGSPQLVNFNVSMNQLGGNLPSLAGLSNLATFDASYNKIGGPIPALTGLGALQTFYVGFNQLTGTVPSLQGLSNLQYFAIDDNQLGGNLPSLTGLSNLVAFLAAGNAFEGTIPSLGGLSKLQLFQIGNNRLSGSIPAVPSPDNLEGGLSSLCPNNLAPSPDTNWDNATGEQPWYSTCSSNESLEAHGAATTKNSGALAFSHDGAIEVFQSQQTDLTANAGNAGGQDVYSFSGGTVQLESVDASGNKLVGVASAPAISPDGKAIAFLFTPNATLANAKDFVTGQIWAGALGQPKHQVDVGMAGVPANGSAAGAPSLSSSGGVQQIVFCSAASNLVPNDANGARDVFIADPMNVSSPLQRISVDSSGAELAGDSCEPKLSSDGSRLVFSLSSSARFGTPARQIMLKQIGTSKVLLTGEMLPITALPNGQGAPADSNEPSVSVDGSVIAFSSTADLDGLGAPVGGREVFISLAQHSGRLLRRARSADGTVPDGASQRPQLSDDGTTLVMQTAAHNFLKPKTLSKDATTAPPQCGAIAITTNFFSVAALGGPLCSSDGRTQNQAPSISGDGATSGFDSNAPQANGNTNVNAWSQGFGAGTGLPPALSGDYSGQWFDPNQSGQGLVVDVLQPDANNNRAVLVTWFVAQGGAPTWLQGVGVAHAGDGAAANTVVVPMQVAIFHGKSFPLGEAQAQSAPWGTITLTFNDANTGSMTWRSGYPGFNSGSMPLKHFLPVALPANTAGNTITSCYSGNWFDRAQVGHGFEFEVLATSPPQLAVDWFAYAPNGDPVWLFGVGPIVGNSAQMTLGIIGGSGAQFPPAFSAGTVTKQAWGTANFTFSDAAHGSVTWSSTLPGYGSGSATLQPLASGLLDRRGCP